MKTFFVQFFCVFLPPLLNIFCFFQVHPISVLYYAHLCMKRSLGISKFVEQISSLGHSLVFLYFFVLIMEEGFSAFKWVYLSISPLPLACLLVSAIVRHPQTTILPFCLSFSWGRSWSLPPVQCHEPPSIVLQVLCLSQIMPWIYLSLPLYNDKAFDLDHSWIV